MKVLLINSHKFGGVEYYRAMQPCNVLMKVNPDFNFFTLPLIHPDKDIPAKLNDEDVIINDDFLKQFDLVHFLRNIGAYGQTELIKKRLDRLGIPFGLDLDDYWHLPDNHLIAGEYKEFNTSQLVIDSIKAAKFVTCTTSILAYEIMKLNPNVFVIENGLDLEHPVWQVEGEQSPYMRFGFMLGSTHFHDLKKAAPSINNILRSKLPNCQIALAGFSAEHGKPSVYVGMERLLTDNYNLINKPYYQYLSMYDKERNHEFNKQPYVRIWGTDVDNWGHTYKHIDVSVVPLVNNHFNNCKSELKVIEAAFKGKAIIASNVPPYTICLNKSNSYLVDNPNNFYDHIKRATNNPNEVVDKINKLREDILPKYNLQSLAKKRQQVYELNK